MAVIFRPWTNRLPQMVAIAGPALLGAVVFGFWYWGSPKFLEMGYGPAQPVPYSHKLHAGDLALDCRYCHNTVERAAHAAVPPTATCMNCHKTVLKDSSRLGLVRSSAETGAPIEWVRVHKLPDFVFFNHSAHLAAGVGCVSCHGRVDQMPVVHVAKPLGMAWCLECHRDPGPSLRPVAEVTNMSWDAATAGYDPAKDPARKRPVNPPTQCDGCHR
ncbi:MAG TPA: cytochrome c3 family protein [Polyangia bacterium]